MRRDLTLHAARPHSLSAHGFEPLVPRNFLFTIPLFGFLIIRPYLSNSIFLGGVLVGTARSSSTSADAFWKFSSSSIQSGRPGSSGSSGSFSLGLVQYRSTGCACEAELSGRCSGAPHACRGNTGRGLTQARRQPLFACWRTAPEQPPAMHAGTPAFARRSCRHLPAGTQPRLPRARQRRCSATSASRSRDGRLSVWCPRVPFRLN